MRNRTRFRAAQAAVMVPLVCAAAAACGGGGGIYSSVAGGRAVSPLAANSLASQRGNPLASSPPGPTNRSLAGMHACRLVTASVVTQMVGEPLERPYETSDGLACFYNSAAADGGPTYILTIVTRSGYEAAKTFAEGVAEGDPTAERLVTGHDLGDDTFSISTDSGGPQYSLWAVKGGAGIEVDVNDLGQGPARAHELVAAALNRL
jgi:hypothetical protein